MKGTWDAGSDPLEALRNGDPSPFEAFVESEAPTFVAFFLRLGAGRSEAEDLTQDVFLKLFRHTETYAAEGRFTAFALRVARNAWIDHTRRQGVRPAPAAGSGPSAVAADAAGGSGTDGDGAARVARDDGGGPSARLERDEEAGRVLAALARLSEPHRLVFELGVVQELPYPEVAALLSIPVGTVKSRMHHAVRKLRELLGEDPTGTDSASAGASGTADRARAADPARDPSAARNPFPARDPLHGGAP